MMGSEQDLVSRAEVVFDRGGVTSGTEIAFSGR